MRFLFISFLFLLFPVTVFGATCSEDLVVNCDASAIVNDGARVRTIPCTEDSGILTVLPKRTKITVLGAKKGWYHIQVGLKKGWIADWLVDLNEGQSCEMPSVTNKLPDESLAEDSKEIPTALKGPVILFNEAEEKKEIIGIDESAYADLIDGDLDLLSRLAEKIVLRVHARGQAYLVQVDGELVSLTGEEVESYKTGTPIFAAVPVIVPEPVVTLKPPLNKESVFGFKDSISETASVVSFVSIADEQEVSSLMDVPAPIRDRKIVGISESDYEALKDNDSSLRNRLLDLIVLRVHHYGEAYWVDPNDGLRFLSGEEVKAYLSAKPSDLSAPTNFVLEGGLVDPGKVRLTWSVDTEAAPYGFKILRSLDPDPIYPGAFFHSRSDATAREDFWAGLKNDQTYYFRVCIVSVDGSCEQYSSSLSIIVSTDGAFAEDTLPGSLALEATAIGGGRGHFSWKAEHVDVSEGLKLLISDLPDPIYPGSAYHRITDPENGHHLWNGLDIGSTFYFRLCQDLGGFCGVYSNGVSMTVQ